MKIVKYLTRRVSIFYTFYFERLYWGNVNVVGLVHYAGHCASADRKIISRSFRCMFDLVVGCAKLLFFILWVRGELQYVVGGT